MRVDFNHHAIHFYEVNLLMICIYFSFIFRTMNLLLCCFFICRNFVLISNKANSEMSFLLIGKGLLFTITFRLLIIIISLYDQSIFLFAPLVIHLIVNESFIYLLTLKFLLLMKLILN